MCSADYNLYKDVSQPLDIFFSWSFYVSEREDMLKYSHKNTTPITGPWGKKNVESQAYKPFSGNIKSQKWGS